jgi:kynureninase
MPADRTAAEALDRQDPLSRFRERFYMPAGAIYLDGNSLGLLSRDAENALLAALAQWKRAAIQGWSSGDPPWGVLDRTLGEQLAPLVGAEPDEVVATGSITVNLHNLVATFYHPEGRRRRIIADALDFPSDIQALTGQIALRGGDPAHDLIRVPSRDGRTIAEDDVIAAMTDEVALAVLPSVLYRSGQLLDMARLTAAARERGILIGWDCAHSVGAIPHRFDGWDVDFAVWCNYKYLNGGPGSVGGLYVNRRHFGRTPGLPGWWGVELARRFEMRHEYEPAGSAAGWQISTTPVLSAAPLLGSLRIVAEAGIDQIRTRSLALTDYLIDLLGRRGLLTPPYEYAIGTPREHARRGGHVAVEHAEAASIMRALERRGVIPDFRPPNVIRLAPVALYTAYADLWDTVEHLKQVIDNDEHHAEVEQPASLIMPR